MTAETIISQRGNHYHFDAVIIGSGVAGLTCALELSQLNSNIRIALICKAELSESNTFYAQGGIAAVMNDNDSVNLHVSDTLSAGDELCYLDSVTNILAEGKSSIEFLIQHGVNFKKNQNGDFDYGQEAGHSKRRIFHCHDQTGKAIIQALSDSIKNKKNITIFENHIAVNLITQNGKHQPGAFPEATGAYILEEKTALIHTFSSNVLILATGGAGKVYRYTSNPDTATGDGIAMAYRAGARVGGMEFYQFHPTLLFHPKLHNFLISEALRGEGAYLRLKENNERFMHRYAPNEMELATRDVVARAIFTEIERSEHDYVYLDISHKSKSFLQNRFPSIYNTLLDLNIDISQDLIPVVPAAHYLCGGILTDVHGQTDLQRLYAIGETAFTGLHGANRLASNSLLEGIVMARNAANSCMKYINDPLRKNIISDWNSSCVVDYRRASQINVHWRGLRGEMQAYAGIIRTEAGLGDQLKLVLARRDMIEEYYWKYSITRDLIELRNILLVAELIVRSALHRKESRGGHYREDFPGKSKIIRESVLKFDPTLLREMEYVTRN